LILEKEKSTAISSSLKKRLQSTIFFPPQSEPSFRETSDRWNRVLERRRIENQEIVAQELEKRHAEIQEIARTDDSQLVLPSLCLLQPCNLYNKPHEHPEISVYNIQSGRISTASAHSYSSCIPRQAWRATTAPGSSKGPKMPRSVVDLKITLDSDAMMIDERRDPRR
jgi:hypothetical protein